MKSVFNSCNSCSVVLKLIGFSFKKDAQKMITKELLQKVRQIEIATSEISSGNGVSDSELMNKVDIKKSEFIGDFIFDFGNSVDFPAGNIEGRRFGQFDSGFFTVPVGSVSLPCSPSLEAGESFLFEGSSILDNVGFRADSLSKSESSSFVLADLRTKDGLMLRLDSAGVASEMVTTNRADEIDLSIPFFRPKLVRTFSGASCLSTIFEKPMRVSFVLNTANGAIPFYFHLWVPGNFSNNIKSLSQKVKGFMGKSWDEMPSVEVWEECLRVLKPGAFCLVMSAPRQDVLSRMIVNLGDAGFKTDFTSIFWTYASGFPKAGNISKLVDKRNGVEREVTGEEPRLVNPRAMTPNGSGKRKCTPGIKKDLPISEQAKALNGSYAGFQPKPAVEVVIVCMKPLSEKSYVDQAIKNGKGVALIDNCKIPYQGDNDKQSAKPQGRTT